MFTVTFDSRHQRIEVPCEGAARQANEFELFSVMAALRFTIGFTALLVAAVL